MTLICDNLAKFELVIDLCSEESNMDDSNSTGPEPIDHFMANRHNYTLQKLF